ncbi:Rieske (2Fe-2S) protein [Phenylobacterium sp.]|uniref:Rieske (2Fe-2S) protein n=1 Tax=Phenylobacterium sp. TaxID=1871053 RepID=UPI002DE21067|nr:Rieske (2Fe-2S) protein [Phenylobacterium sp.]
MTGTWIGSDLPPIWRHGEEYFLLGHDEALYLVRNRCPHRGGPLKAGFINAAGELVCPMHRGAFAVDQLISLPTTIRLDEGPTP